MQRQPRASGTARQTQGQHDHVRRAADEARALVDRHWFAVDRVARKVQQRGGLSGVALAAIITAAEAEWAQMSGYRPELTPFAYALERALRGQAPPPLQRPMLAAAVLKAALAGHPDVQAAAMADLVGRGYPENACRDLWKRAAAAPTERG